ncbi:MAG: hypothetical protein Q9161_001361, partial [Pseudevernia consocians]
MDSIIGTPCARNIKSQHTTSQHLTHQPSHNSLKRQITDQLVAPSNVLNYERPIKRQKHEQLPASQGMDKRHPSSFQQLEKLGEGTYAT